MRFPDCKRNSFMAQRRPPGARRPSPYQPPQFHSDYESYSPSSGYTPPYKPPQPPPPKGVYGRSKQAWRTYRGLDQRARADSMVWWGFKFLQGLVFGGGLFLIGVLSVILSALLGSTTCLSGAGITMLLIGIVILLYYAAAPVTCKWMVVVPDNHYWVVEDINGLTIHYVPPGKRVVPWQRSIKVCDYVDFRWFTVNQVIKNALQIGGVPVTLEIAVVVNFDPTAAHTDQYGTLRELATREQFEAMFAREVQGIVRYALSHSSSAGQQALVRNPQQLEDAITQELAGYSDMGLTLASSRPVSVFVHGAPPLEPDVEPPPPMPEPPPAPQPPPTRETPPPQPPPSPPPQPGPPIDPMVRRSRRRGPGSS